MSRSQQDIKVDPQKVILAQKATFCVAVEADVSASLDGLYWNLFAASGAAYYVWYNVDGASTDPTPGGAGLEVNITTGASAATVAAAVSAVIDAEADFSSVVNPRNAAQVIVKTATYEDAAIPTAGSTTGHGFLKIHEGFELDMGFTDGDLELTMDQQLLDVTAHQSGTDILTSLVTGNNVELSVAFKEYSEANLNKLIKDTSGGSYTPIGGTELRGYGTGQNFSNVLDKSLRVILHPARIADTNDRSKDLCLLLAYPKPDSVTFSGENPTLLNFTFRVFQDDFVDSAVNKVALGDHLQL